MKTRIRDEAIRIHGKATSDTLQVVMDVLAYIRRSDDFFTQVSEAIRGFAASTTLPKMLVGHSLGGIMLVDTLARMGHEEGGQPEIDLLVTLGSQAPYLYAIDAMPNIPLRELPDIFLPWLNVWNPNDFLSFPAQPAFGIAATARHGIGSRTNWVRDLRSDLPVLFPEAHSVYYGDRMVPAAIQVALDDLDRLPTDPELPNWRKLLRNHALIHGD